MNINGLATIIGRIKRDASDIESSAELLADFSFHAPVDTSRGDLVAAARDLRKTANLLEKLSEKAPTYAP